MPPPSAFGPSAFVHPSGGGPADRRRPPVEPPATGQPDVDPATPAGSVLVRVVAWIDPLVDATGVDPRAAYVEHFWLPVLGPSATWLVRRLADVVDGAPEGGVVDLGDLACSLGVGGIESRHTPLRRALRRCARFGLLRPEGPDRLAVRRRLAPLPQHHLAQLPDDLRRLHRRWEQAPPTAESARRRARLLALDAAVLGEPPAAVERRLLRWGVHPALAYESAGWAAARPGVALAR